MKNFKAENLEAEKAALIAWDLTKNLRSFVLKELTVEQSDKVFTSLAPNAKYNENLEQMLSEFGDSKEFEDKLVGKGFMVCLSHRLNSPEESPDGVYVEVILPDGKRAFYDMLWIGDIYPVTEGIFAPGIYELYEHCFYEFKNVRDFTRTFLEDPNIDFDKIKLSFSMTRVDAFETTDKDTEEYCFERLPFTYFDVECPVCGRTILTYETAADDSADHRCEITELPCDHFIGNLVGDGKFSREELAEFGCEYRLENDGQNLFLKNSSGVWQQAILRTGIGNKKLSLWTENDYFVFLNEPAFEGAAS